MKMKYSCDISLFSKNVRYSSSAATADKFIVVGKAMMHVYFKPLELNLKLEQFNGNSNWAGINLLSWFLSLKIKKIENGNKKPV